MIKMRLIRLLAESKKYIIYQVLWQWLSLFSQIVLVCTVAMLLEQAFLKEITTEKLWMRMLTAAGCMVLRMFCDWQASRASYAASVDVKRILREKIYEKLLKLGASYREQISTSEVVQMSAEGVEQLETYFGRYLPQLFYSLLAPMTLFLVLARVNIRASLVLLICVPLIPLSIVAVQKIAKRLLGRYWGMYARLGDSFLENLQGLTTLKIYRADEKKAQEMDVESQNFRRITMKVLTMQLNSTSVMDIVAYGGAAIGIAAALREFLSGRIGIAGILMIILLASEFFIPLRLLGSFFHIAMNGMAASDRMFEFLDLPEPEAKTKTVVGDSVSVRLSDVRFSYGESGGEGETGDAGEVLRGVSLEFAAGSFVSLVGTSGCGKSTIAGILMGRNRGYTGSIRVCSWKQMEESEEIYDEELSDIDEGSLMEHITMVSSNSYLFKGTVAENLKMGRPKASDEMLWDVLRQVNLEEFLRASDGLDTPVAEKGSNFSGGQCQRLALARALLHDTPVYIFDEATSNIDVESEEMIMEVIHRLSQTKTVILISHRLANVTRSDCIYMLKDGKIAESGFHDQLMMHEGPYYSLYTEQKRLEQYGQGDKSVDNIAEYRPTEGRTVTR